MGNLCKLAKMLRDSVKPCAVMSKAVWTLESMLSGKRTVRRNRSPLCLTVGNGEVRIHNLFHEPVEVYPGHAITCIANFYAG